jgi:hypothetical protein
MFQEGWLAQVTPTNRLIVQNQSQLQIVTSSIPANVAVQSTASRTTTAYIDEIDRGRHI